MSTSPTLCGSSAATSSSSPSSQRRFADDDRLRYLIGDVRDLPRLTRATRGVDVIIHAAAMKQVPACEYNPFEAVKTNILGARTSSSAAIENDVPLTLALSTDKAVNPVNLYGATKLCAEKIVAQGNAYAADSPARFASSATATWSAAADRWCRSSRRRPTAECSRSPTSG